ncbi:Hydroxymethylpyrimidine kinase [Vibrio scophthalmi]|uniref:Hydroxymethylpyrimidine kinase n=1 Tax=Vibrio scophthalmi TaxID=45658 RepID=A0A1E3WI69_9VIBR|nr:Hydroxymethylpyrimidine kinase [Vibrio scophthalmi]
MLILKPCLRRTTTPIRGQRHIAKGEHLAGDENSNDLFIQPDSVSVLYAKRIATHNTHGTGCTLSAAIASYLAQGESLESAVAKAKHYISLVIGHADELSIGHGPVHHFFAYNREQ